MTQIPVAGLHAELALGTAKLQSGVSDADRLLNRLQDKMTGTGRKAKKTGDEIDTGIGRGLKGAAASASAFDRRMDFLQKRFDPLYAASKRYEGELRLLDEAQKRGAISSATYTRNLDRMNAELAGVDTSVAGAAAQMGRFNGVASGMSAQTGNIAAQFQDIGVQLAGGQSPFLIALQQGTQLNGVFTSMGGGIRQVGPALMTAFSSLLSPLSLATIGVIAFGGAIFQWFTGSQEKAKSLEEAVGDVSSAVSDLQRITDLLGETDLTGIREQFGGLSADVVELLTLQRELAVMDAMRGISDAISAARESMDGWITSGLDGIKAAFDTTYDRARQIQMLMDEVAAATTPQEALDRTIALRQAIEEVAGPLNTLSDSAFEMLKALAEGESALRQVVVQAERSETALENARVEADRLAVAAPGAGWMGTAIKETNLLIGRLIEARVQRDAMLAVASSANYDKLLANTGQSSGPDSVRSRVQFRGGAFAPPVIGAGLRFSGVSGSSGGGRAGGAGAAGLSDIAREAERLNTAVKDGTTPLEKYRAGLAKLEDLKKNGLTDLAYSKEAARLNEELTGSLPLVDDVADAFGAFVSRGFSDFKSFTNSIMGSFKKMLAEMIATAAKNQIMIAIGGKAAGGGGLLAGLLGGGGAGGGLLGGLGKLLGGGGAAGGAAGGGLLGGLGKLLGIGGAAGGAAGGGLLAGLGGSAALGPIGIGVALLGGLFGRRRARRRAEQERRAAEQAAAAQAEAQRVQAEAQQRSGLETQIFSLQGNTAELRRRELEALIPANRELQERIWKLEDEQRISGERKGLEEELLRLQGDTTELRRRELEALDPSNRALKENIWRIEDAAEATEKLSEAMGRFKEEDFATLLDFNRARGALAYGGVAPSVVPFPGAVDPARQAVRNDDLWTSINNRLAQIEKYFVRWDIDGLPAERAA
jgi:hypothetical protein